MWLTIEGMNDAYEILPIFSLTYIQLGSILPIPNFMHSIIVLKTTE